MCGRWTYINSGLPIMILRCISGIFQKAYQVEEIESEESTFWNKTHVPVL